MNILQKLPRTIFYWKYRKALSTLPIQPDKSVAIGDGSIVRIDLYDVLNNKDINKLIRKIAKLRKSNFKTKLYYKKRGFRERDYIHPQFDHRSVGLFADIELLDDGFIRRVGMAWTQINNDEAVMQYSFTLSRPVHTVTNCKDKVLEYWNLIKHVDVVPYYKSVDDLISDPSQNNQHIYNLFLSIFQGFINKNLYTNLGHQYPLPVNVLHLTKNGDAVNKLIEDDFIYNVYKKDKSEVYIIHGPVDRWQIDTVIIGDSYGREDLLEYFSKYGMDYYYLIFGYIEINELSSRLVGYLNSGKTKISFKNRKWLLRKFRRVSEIKLFPKKHQGSSEIIGLSGNVSGQDYIIYDLAQNFKDVYEDNLKYVNSVFGLADVHIWVWVLLVMSFLSLIASLTALVYRVFAPS